jgi:xanthine dehydrogenase/oxidase
MKGHSPRARILGGSHSYPPQYLRMISGNTDIGYAVRYHPERLENVHAFISTMGIPELHQIKMSDEFLEIGSSVTINRMKSALISAKESRPSHETRFADPLITQIAYFANNQVRDMGTLGGSIMAADATSDLIPPLIALGTQVCVGDRERERERERERVCMMCVCVSVCVSLI